MTINVYVRRREATRRHLMETGMALILQEGYDNVTITRIAEVADYGRGTFYEYFTDKDDLIIQTIETMSVVHEDAINASVAHLDQSQREFQVWVDTFRSFDTYKHIFYSLQGHNISGLMERYIEFRIKRVETALEQGVFAFGAEMNVPTPIIARFLTGAMTEVIRYWLSQNCQPPASDMARMMFNMLYHTEPPEE